MLALRNESLLDQLLAGKVNLADKTIDNCPIEVFRPESNYYRSLNDIISRYKEMIKSKEEQLALIENVDVYINEHFTEEYKKREQKVLEEIEEVKRTYTNPKPFIDRLLKVMDNLDEIVTERLKHEYFKENHICPEMKKKLEDEIYEYKRVIDAKEADMVEWKEYCLEQAKEEEKEMLKQLLKIPHSKEDVIIHVNEYIKEKLGHEFSELLAYYHELVIDMIRKMTHETKYDLTIQSVISERGTTNFYRIFDSHNEFIKQNLFRLTSFMVQNMSENVSDENNGFVVAEEYLKNSFDAFITKHFMEIAQILQQKIRSTNAENGFTNLSVSGSAAVKNVTREFVSKVTKLLKEEVEDLIMKSFNNYFSTLQEQFKQEKKPIIEEVEAENDTEEFIDFINSDQKYSIQELTDLYNEFNNSNLSTISVSKLSYIRQHFNKKREANPRTCKREFMYKLKD